MKSRRICCLRVATLVLPIVFGSPILGAETSGSVRTWQEAADRWNIELTATDEILLCINYSAIAGSIAYGAGDKSAGADFVEISKKFETKLRLMHGEKIADLLMNATTAVMLNTIDLAGEPTQYDEWELANFNRCKDVAQRIEE